MLGTTKGTCTCDLRYYQVRKRPLHKLGNTLDKGKGMGMQGPGIIYSLVQPGLSPTTAIPFVQHVAKFMYNKSHHHGDRFSSRVTMVGWYSSVHEFRLCNAVKQSRDCVAVWHMHKMAWLPHAVLTLVCKLRIPRLRTFQDCAEHKHYYTTISFDSKCSYRLNMQQAAALQVKQSM